MAGSKRRALVSLTMSAPASRAARATAALVVSTESRAARLPAQGFDDRDDPPQLLGLGDRERAGAGALPADVEDVRALGGEREAAVDRLSGVEVAPAVGEGVGRDVEDAHEPGARTEVETRPRISRRARLSVSWSSLSPGSALLGSFDGRRGRRRGRGADRGPSASDAGDGVDLFGADGLLLEEELGDPDQLVLVLLDELAGSGRSSA